MDVSKGDQTRQRVLRSAAELFRRQGYHATGLNQILGAGQAPKGALYFHFPGGKEQVAVEAVTAAAAEMGSHLRDVLAEAGESKASGPQASLRGVADLFAAHLVASGYLDGCPVAAVAQDAAGASEPIRAACGQAYAAWLGVIETALLGWGVPAERSGPLATVVLSSMEGALLLARVQHDTGPLRTVADHLTQLITTAITA
jgi:TetR/AcrR family transcriptional repressor of lmrAB and yxaGH operons